MSVHVSILDGPLPGASREESAPVAGAVLVFEGIVREDEDGRKIDALDYQAYEPMAQTMLERLARHAVESHGLLGMQVEHSRGRVPVGECSFRLTVTAPHRKQALLAMDEFIDALKRDVPIWKRPVLREQSEKRKAKSEHQGRKRGARSD